ncbi:MAG: hypothetical protein KatS3mg108_3024 [Isosphaeraceae bacterium]|jgi:hypothetical protein|nr:MAG: hypothetical protein KatS3mg108_3024 [Isosphaeraceae bacterium]
MTTFAISCPRCDSSNHSTDRFCALCGLPLGTPSADPDPATSLFDHCEPPDPSDRPVRLTLRDFVARSGLPASPAGVGWRVVVPLDSGRRQAVHLAHVGSDPDDRPLLALASIVGPANARDLRDLLRLNARVVEGHFAICLLRGEEYFIVIHNLPADRAAVYDPAALIRRVAETADRLEQRLSRGHDRY